MRPLDPPADDAAVLELVEAYEATVRELRIEPAQEVLDQLRALPGAGARDCLVVLDGTGTLVGLLPWEVDDDADVPVVWFDVYTHLPAAVEDAVRAPLEEAMIASALTRARAWLNGSAHPRALVQTGTYRADAALAGRFVAAGLAHERTFFAMVTDLGPEHADPGPAPDGVRVRVADPQEAAAVHEVVEEAFVDHWSHQRETFDAWWARRSAAPAYDPGQWWVAERDGRVVATCLGDVSRAALGGGYVRYLAVLRPARGLGVARHLLRVAFAEHHRRGWTWSSLGVDADSPTGATHLYRSVGMREVDTVDVHQGELRREDGAAGPGAQEAAATVADPTTRVPS